MSDLLRQLKSTFGYSTFRPLQREIIEASLAGRDVFALLPTGGGKSLCFQLPALAREGLTVVVSPLIALMKDQVDELTAKGVAAAFVNSSLPLPEHRPGLRQRVARRAILSPRRFHAHPAYGFRPRKTTSSPCLLRHGHFSDHVPVFARFHNDVSTIASG